MKMVRYSHLRNGTTIAEDSQGRHYYVTNKLWPWVIGGIAWVVSLIYLLTTHALIPSVIILAVAVF